MLKHFIRAHWFLFVSLLFLSAVALTAARLWVPSLGNYHQELEAAASKALGREVTVGKLEATWRGLGPVLKLKDVVIEGSAETREPLDVEEVWIRLDVRHYLKERTLRVYGIDVIGAEIGITRDADGRIYIDEFDQGDQAGGFEIDEYLMMRRLSVNDSIVTFTDRQSAEPPHRFSDVTLALKMDGRNHELSGYAMLPPELGYRVDVSATLAGEGSDFSNWSGNAYLKGQVLALSDLTRSILPQGLTMHGIADVRMWVNYSSGELQSLSGELDAHTVRIENHSESEASRYAADAMRGSFGWRQADDGWQLALQDFSVLRDGVVRETQNLSLSALPDNDVTHMQLRSQQMHLDGMGAMLSIVPGLKAQQRRNLVAMNPRGSLTDLQLALEISANAASLKRFSAAFASLAIQQTTEYPSVSGLSGEVTGSPQLGRLSVSGSAVGFHDSRLFSEPLTPFGMHADFNWQNTGAGLELVTENLQLENRDLAVHGSLGLDLPDGGAASMNLQLAVDNADVGRVSAYLPDKRMRPKGVAWLKKSLVSGAVENGSIHINGRLDRIPFDNNDGRLEVRLPVKNALLDYNKRWSPVVGMAAQVNIDGRALKITSSQGAIRTALIRKVEGYIPDLVRPVLDLKGSIDGPLSVMLAELGSSPLGNSYGKFVDRVQTSGQAALDLDLDLVLHGENKSVSVSGQAGLVDNELQLTDSNITLKKINGTLLFDNKGIRGDNLETELYGKPAKVRVWSEAGKEQKITRVSLDGKLGLLRQIIGEQSPLHPAISGDSDWNVVLTIAGTMRRDEKANLSLYAGSMLAGTAIDLPAPLGKDGATRRELSMHVSRLDFPQKLVKLKYGDSVNGLLSVAFGKAPLSLQGGEIIFGGGLPTKPARKRLLVSGNLEQVRTTDWKPFIETDRKDAGLPVELDVDIDDLEILGHHVHDVSMQMASASAGLVWNIKADGPSVRGTVQLTKVGGVLDKAVMTLERLVVKSGVAAGSRKKTKVTPAAFPNLQIATEQFIYDDINLGNLQLVTARQPGNALKISRLVLSSEMLEANLKGSWKMQDLQQRSNIDMEISKGKVDELLEVLGFQRSIEGGDLSGSMRAAWAGPPWAFTPSLAEGEIQLLVENGQLVDIEPGAAGRILGLLSLNNIRRRLVLDFSDLFGEGFSFDRIEGGFVVADGNAYTSDLYVKGPAAKVDITGRVGLAAKDYDQEVTVTPTVKTPFSLAGTLVGGPAIGAAIMVAETLLEGKIEALNKMVRTRYTITGPWSDPQIRKIEQQDEDETAPANPLEE